MARKAFELYPKQFEVEQLEALVAECDAAATAMSRELEHEGLSKEDKELLYAGLEKITVLKVNLLASRNNTMKACKAMEAKVSKPKDPKVKNEEKH